ncbi:discoidin domain-containing protein [Paenibacillus sp. L3-i20]|uniref:discoidin domain-containing protein n=1 Tax=Paenibacillus sp. L3-i20 TaxID=2905833 RepID=UPI001EDD548F|nr:discoidin domain-containing protein [Paenibacillus sp. L3-i20]GKU80562.1 hypothetical protein L3i20_v249590 [Paenibacillus sp. L3-i20]
MMKKFGKLVLAAVIGLGIASNVDIRVADAAETTIITDPVNLAVGGTVTASGEYGTHQDRNKAFDQYIFSKWLTFNSPAWLQYEFAAPKVINYYTITSAEDEPYRDPKSWVVKGSNDGITWTNLDSQQNQTFATRHQKKTYTIVNTTAYKFVKFDNFTNQNEDNQILQIAEIGLFGSEVQTFKTIKPTVTASEENAPYDLKANLVDGKSMTKWMAYNNTAWLQFDFGEAVTIDGYALASAKSNNMSTDADPKSWVLQGSNDNTSWTTLDTRNDEKFKFRHQRKHYLLNDNTTAYRYYKLSNIKNNSGFSIQLSEVEFSRTDDMWHTENPIIEVKNIASFAAFEQAFPHAEKEILAVLRKANDIFYNSPAEMPVRMKKIALHIVDQPGFAWISGDAELKTIGISSQFLATVAPNELHDEIIGLLYHELGHAYQYSNLDIEGIADSLRFEAGYHHRYGITPVGDWHSNGPANFFRWIGDTKHDGFIRDINATSLIPYGLNPKQIIAWKEARIKSITGIDVNTLWTQYKQSLSNQ